jgi:hypothetical protein
MATPIRAWGADLTVAVGPVGATVDVSCDVVSVDVTRGKTRVWDTMSAATCALVLNAGTGGQPNTRGPVYSHVDVSVSWGSGGGTVFRTIFYGKVQQRRLESTPAGTFLHLDCVDAFEKMGHQEIRDTTSTPVGAGETVDQRIDRWLTVAGFTDTRALDVSDYTCPEVVIDGNVLANLHNSARADGGDFYIDGDGTARFRPWAWQAGVTTVDAIFSDRKLYGWVPYSSAVWRDDLDEVQNHVYGARRQFDTTVPVVQQATNFPSISTFGARGDNLDQLEVDDNTQVAARVLRVVTTAAQPAPRFDPIVVQPALAPSLSWPRVLAVHWGSLIACNRKYVDGTDQAAYSHVIGERWVLTATDATVTFRTSGTLGWDGLHPPLPPLQISFCPDGSIQATPGTPCNDTVPVVIFNCDTGEILATFPAGSICTCGNVFLPDAPGVPLCVGYDDGSGTILGTPISDPRLQALLWFDVLHPGGELIEKIDGDHLTGDTAFFDTRIGALTGVDAVDADGFGGQIAHSHSDHVAAASLTGGWTVDFWFHLDHLPTGSVPDMDIIDLDTVKIRLALTHTYFDVVIHMLGITVTQLTVPTDPGHDDTFWHHYVFTWDPTHTGSELSVTIDGIP